ncbi:MAG TPA: hypothetical protein VFV93_06600, partial [Thermomicrobiales bacterium]|nr:hypothetical protein [Thermomicrobiales bacterium]
MTYAVAALVPMRHESERVPGKNYRLLAGKPLFHYILQSLLASPRVSDVVIDTDSELIRDDVAVAFPSVRVIERPPHLRDGKISMNAVLLNDVEQIGADIYLQTHSTNPFLKSGTVTAAVDAFLGNPGCDSLFSVTRRQTRLWSADGRPLNHDPEQLLRTQDLDP